jgi:unsaturated rhamnogalacturonyl hydrolase
LNTYPRTTQDGPFGGFLHRAGLTGQLWGDGAFMVLPFLARFGQLFNDQTYANDESARQLEIYYNHLHNPATGLLFHAYDETGDTSWVVSGTRHSPESWCRAMGWFGMATVEVLETLPASHPKQAQVLAKLQALVAGMAKYQDGASGRWFQVVDKGRLSDNWLETSCSSMYTYVISRSVERGWVGASYASVADKGYQGVLSQVSRDSNGLSKIKNISIGTNVGVLSYYLARTRATNDFHGLGAFLIMFEQEQRKAAAPAGPSMEP